VPKKPFPIRFKSPIQLLADGFREMVSGSRDGRPKWIDLIDQGDDLGLFGAESAVWKVNGNISTILGGIRALVLQAAHPAALAGVAQHSRYQSDLQGRLVGTSKWLTLTTFAATDVIAAEAARVNALHRRVSGEYENKAGVVTGYQASDPNYLLWVHCAFTESFLETFLALGNYCDSDQYVAEWSKSALALGLHNAPKSKQELAQAMKQFAENELSYSQATAEVLNFLLHPPLPFAGRIAYQVFARAALITLSDYELRILRLSRPNRLWMHLARAMLWALNRVLGQSSPAERAARARAARISSVPR
jgi:uncharacterized protein (DUF2236 family)